MMCVTMGSIVKGKVLKEVVRELCKTKPCDVVKFSLFVPSVFYLMSDWCDSSAQTCKAACAVAEPGGRVVVTKTATDN